MDDLKTKTTTELRTMLKQLGAKSPRGRATQKRLIAAVRKAQREFEIDQSPSGVIGVPQGEDTPLLDNVKSPAMSPVPDTPLMRAVMGGCTKQQVIEAIRHYAAKGMTVKFLDNTWEFRKGDKIDTGTMSQPIYNIVKCAEALCRDSVSANRMFLKN